MHDHDMPYEGSESLTIDLSLHILESDYLDPEQPYTYRLDRIDYHVPIDKHNETEWVVFRSSDKAAMIRRATSFVEPNKNVVIVDTTLYAPYDLREPGMIHYSNTRMQRVVFYKNCVPGYCVVVEINGRRKEVFIPFKEWHEDTPSSFAEWIVN